jgi:hypothetical protein
VYTSYKNEGGIPVFDPIPVKVSVGNFMELEPLIINDVGVSFSKETFINKDGLHLPIYVEADISLSFWLTPTPNVPFLKLFGSEVFNGASYPTA